MATYLVEGRIIPERVDYNAPPLELRHDFNDARSLTTRIEVIKSKIFVHVATTGDFDISEIRNLVFSTVGDLANFAGFHLVIGISYEIDSITNIETKQTTVFGTDGHVFHNIEEFGDRLTFRSGKFGAPLQINVSLLIDRALSRATFELRCAIRYPDYTALHCRLALEAIRNAFNSDDEADGWRQLRENMKVSRATIESFKDAATEQRHGRNSVQTWEQRRHCMQIAWEVVHRYTIFVSTNPKTPLNLPEL